MKEAQQEAEHGEVVLVSLGPEKAVESLRKALAMGADRAVLISDAGAAAPTWGRVALAAALERRKQTSSSSDKLERWRRGGALGRRRRPAGSVR